MKFGKNKYRNVPVVYAGVRYDSKAEARRAGELDLLRDAGEIRFWVRQVTFRLGCPENVYRPDFLVIGSGDDVHAEDVKGSRTAKFNRDVKLWRAYGPCPLHVITGRNVEVVLPEKSRDRQETGS